MRKSLKTYLKKYNLKKSLRKSRLYKGVLLLAFFGLLPVAHADIVCKRPPFDCGDLKLSSAVCENLGYSRGKSCVLIKESFTRDNRLRRIDRFREQMERDQRNQIYNDINRMRNRGMSPYTISGSCVVVDNLEICVKTRY